MILRSREQSAAGELLSSVRLEPGEVMKRLRALRDSGNGVIVGTDEAGRGPLAGPVVAAAVFMTQEQEKSLLALGLRDSKKMTARGRERIWEAMAELGVLWRAQAASVARIDWENISRASL